MKSTRHSRTDLYVHLIWSTKNRAPVLDRVPVEKISTLLRESARNQSLDLVANGGAEDHLHVFVKHRPDHRVSEIVRQLKAVLSYWIRKETGLQDFAWQEGYGAFSVSPHDVATVAWYIQHQGEHHRDLQEEEQARARPESALAGSKESGHEPGAWAEQRDVDRIAQKKLE